MIQEKKQHWLNHPNLDAKLKQELENLSDKDAHDAFYTHVEFGTAGMRGLLGVGPNRMNVHTIRKANVAFARYLSQYENAYQHGVAIAYDNRHMSYEFAVESARVLAMHNIPSYVFKELRPTPELSFAVRQLHCEGGIVITASHNPKEYNGYKVYDCEGCQLVPELIDQVIHEIEKIDDELDIVVKLSPKQETLIHWILEDIDEAYIKQVLSIQLRPKQDKSHLSLVFTPQHGTALLPITQTFKQAGYHLDLVESQCSPDPNFSNTLSPNPEEAKAYTQAIELAQTTQADGVLSTDPDADRMGVVVKHKGEYTLLTGNQTGSILIEYLLSTLKEQNNLPENAVIFNTVVTSDLGEKVAKHYGVDVEKTLTGFKFIGDKIARYEKTLEKTFIMGYEESYGYLIKAFVRDKDAIQACLILAEAMAYYKQKGHTLIDVLESLYQRHGYHHEDQVSLSLAGSEGAQRIKDILAHFRETTIDAFAGIQVHTKEDYLTSLKTEGQKTTKLNFPSADVIKYTLEDGSWIAIRPSGTEPKCKFYFCVLGNTHAETQDKFKTLKQALAAHYE